jgi:hypothetical protein
MAFQTAGRGTDSDKELPLNKERRTIGKQRLKQPALLARYGKRGN